MSSLYQQRTSSSSSRLSGRGAAGEEEAAGLAGPGEERGLRFREPCARRRVGCADAAGPDGVDHARQAEKLLLTAAKPVLPLRLRVRVRLLHARERPVAPAERSDAAGGLVLVEHVDELADGDVRVVAMHQVDVGVVGSEALEAFEELSRQVARGAEAACARLCR